ncbi:hypothetical protein D9758_016345 [Tetrapyrgos nigripes]|uniref:DUF6534 domain-containing protein n=1 Tax=Tetrapyrgos nigripes TaxID=182062 RepID=A0A8H5FC01_9AGAR|nr:hypothetical protein D9758_016345 [Tetrapyrgos nigripes]
MGPSSTIPLQIFPLPITIMADSLPPPSPSVPEDIILITGPVLVGSLLSYLLMGSLIVQLYIYYMSFPNDGIFVKFTVYSVFIFDLISTIAITESAWLMLIPGWGRPENLHLVDWGFTTVPLWNALSSAIVQVYFGYRVWTLGNLHGNNEFERTFWKGMTALIFAVSFTQVIGAIVSTARFFPLNDIFLISICYPSTATWLSASAIADVLITTSMTVLLSKAMSRTRKDHVSDSTRQTDALLTKIIRNTIETAAVTAGAAVLELIFFFRLPNTAIHIAIALVLSKLYTNTLLAALNARASFLREEKNMDTTKDTGPMSLTDSRFDDASNYVSRSSYDTSASHAHLTKKRMSDFTTASTTVDNYIQMESYGYSKR